MSGDTGLCPCFMGWHQRRNIYCPTVDTGAQRRRRFAADRDIRLSNQSDKVNASAGASE
jgi:hypothetical protein